MLRLIVLLICFALTSEDLTRKVNNWSMSKNNNFFVFRMSIEGHSNVTRHSYKSGISSHFR